MNRKSTNNKFRPASLRQTGTARTVLLRMAADQERAERIRALKEERPDLTWRRIADHVGVSERAASEWKNTGGIDYANVVKLAALFEVDVDYIWRGTPEEQRAPSPFAGQDGLADRLDAIERALAEAREEREEHAAHIQRLLKRQDAVLHRIEQSIQREEQAKTETEEATKRLLAAAETARRELRRGTRSPEPAPGTQAT